MVVKVLIADDHRLTVEGVRRALEDAEDITVVGVALSGRELPALVQRTSPDLVLLDARMPGGGGLGCLELIHRQHPAVKIVVFSDISEPKEIDRALRSGACAYILKSVHPADLASALRQVAEQTVFHTPVAANGHSEREPEALPLTDRELTMLRAVARGLSNKAISQELWVTEQTVKFHLSNVYRKLGVSNRTAAVRHAHEHRLIDPSVSRPAAVAAA